MDILDCMWFFSFLFNHGVEKLPIVCNSFKKLYFKKLQWTFHK